MTEDQKAIVQHMRSLNNAIKRHIDRYSESKKQLENLSCSGGMILARVFESEHYNEPLYQRDFENEFGITRSTASKVLGGLEQKGLISRVGVEHDARLKQILTTEKSREIGQSIFREMTELEKNLEAGFTPEELETLYGFFERIENNLTAAADKQARENTNDKEAEKVD